MGVALEEAALAAGRDDIPIGCVVVVDGRIVARRHNEREALGDLAAHAEVLALRDAAAAVGDGWRLEAATVVVTVEPCPMCAGAIVAARAARVVFGAPNPEAGSMGTLYHLGADPRLNHEVETVGGGGAEQAAAHLAGFFAGKRAPAS